MCGVTQENQTTLPQCSGPFTLCKRVYCTVARWLLESSRRLWSFKFHIAHRAKQDLWEYRKHGAAKGTEAADLIQASLFWRLCWLYLLPSHTAPLHKPDSPLSQSWCKQQESFVSSQSWAGEWKSTQWHVICIDSTEGLGDDQRCLGRGRAETCCCNSWAPQVPRICLDFFFLFRFSPFLRDSNQQIPIRHLSW